MNQKIFILLFAIMLFGSLMPSINSFPANIDGDGNNCPDPPPYCDDTEVCIYNQDTNTCTCSCCDSNGQNCHQNYPS
ncbi:hypothetical protein C2G38_2121741 [Gigaspora rosea]|uniref:Uncharacterized protein n=1 Tax=Gigaspora rosea TaxID=44941 RepID=A0A397U1C1_9GLOM|nr:hypothetical protein C2G38_2121741 [Gigaspora rosea]